MSVESRLMEPGRWEVSLIDDTPPSVLDQVVGTDGTEGMFDLLVITPVEVLGDLTDDRIISLSTYAGPYRRVDESGRVLEGAGLEILLGDEEGKGPIIETAIDITDGTFVQWMEALIPVAGINGITRGTFTEPAGGRTLTWTTIYQTRRDAIQTVCDFFDCEWKINHQTRTIDAGPQASLFNTLTSPPAEDAVIITRYPAGADPQVRGLHTEQMEKTTDAENWASKVLTALAGLGLSQIAVGSASLSPNPYVDPAGNPIVMTKLVDIPQGAFGTENTLATEELARATVDRHIPLSTDTYAALELFELGDELWVWDPEWRLVDTANEVPFRGIVTHPIKQRVYAVTMPIERGMGVYFRKWDASAAAHEYVDLTPFVEWEEDPGARFEQPPAVQPFDFARIDPRRL